MIKLDATELLIAVKINHRDQGIVIEHGADISGSYVGKTVWFNPTKEICELIVIKFEDVVAIVDEETDDANWEKELALIEWIEPGVKCDIHVNGEATVRNCTVSAYPYIDKHGNYLCILDELECPQPVETLSPSDDANGDKTATPPNMEEKGQ